MASTPTKNKRFTTRFDAGPTFIPGGAPIAHEVLSEGGIFRRNRIGPHSDNPVSQAESARTRGTIEIKRGRTWVFVQPWGVEIFTGP